MAEATIPPTIITQRLILRPFSRADIRAYSAVRAEPMVARWLRAPLPGETADQISARVIDHFNQCWQRDGFGPWAITDAEHGRLIGHCGLRRLNELGGVEVIYALLPSHWRRGLASEAAATALDFGFGPAGLETIFAITLPHNRASRGVMEKLGMGYRRDVSFNDFNVAYYDIDRATWMARPTR